MSNTVGELLQGKRILFVSSFIAYKLKMFEHIASMGVKIVLLDKADSAITPHVESGLIEAHIEADIDDLSQLDSMVKAIKDSGLAIDGLATIVEFATVLTAKIADALGLLGHSIRSVEIARNKYDVRQLCDQAGITSARFALIHNKDDLLEHADRVGFPCILKPVKGSASTDVSLVYNKDQLLNHYERIITTRVGQSPDLKGIAHTIWSDSTEMILEEYLDGDEFDVDVLLSGGEVVFYSLTSESPQPNMVETGGQLPARYPQDKQEELVAYVAHILKALAFTDGVFHVEVKYTSNGPRLIEVNARVVGANIFRFIKLVWGVDLIEQYLLTCLGQPIQPQKAAEPQTYVVNKFLVAPYSGLMTNSKFLQHLDNDPRILHAEVYPSEGQHIRGPANTVPQWLGQVVVQGSTPEEAESTMNEVLDKLDIPLKKMTTLEFNAVS